MTPQTLFRRLSKGLLLAAMLGLASCDMNVGVGMNMGVPNSWGSGNDMTVPTTAWGGRPGN
jgi:hypothetical protein